MLTVAHGHAPDGVFQVGVVLQSFENRRLALDFDDAGIERRLARRFKVNKLVDQQAGNDRAGNPVKSVAALLPALQGLALTCPEVKRQHEGARIQQIAVAQHLVALVVIGCQPQRTRLDAHVDVLGHKHHFALGMRLAQSLDHAKNLVVRLALRQAHGQGIVQWLGLEKQAASGLAVTCGVQLETLGNISAVCACQCIKSTAGLPGIASHFSHAFFVAIEFFQHDHWQEDIVFLEAEQAHRIVHQHIGVQHEQPCWASWPGFFGLDHVLKVGNAYFFRPLCLGFHRNKRLLFYQRRTRHGRCRLTVAGSQAISPQCHGCIPISIPVHNLRQRFLHNCSAPGFFGFRHKGRACWRIEHSRRKQGSTFGGSGGQWHGA